MMPAHHASDDALKARLRSATRSPKIPHTHRVVGKLPLTYDLAVPQHTAAAIFGLGAFGAKPVHDRGARHGMGPMLRHTPAGIFGLGAMAHKIPRVKGVALTRNRVAVPVPRNKSVKLGQAGGYRTRQAYGPMTRQVAPAPGAFFPGMGDLGAYGVIPMHNPPPGTRWMQKHSHRYGQVDGLGAFSQKKLRAQPPRVIGVPRTSRVPIPQSMGRSRDFIPGLGEEDSGDTLEMGHLTAPALAADLSPAAPGATAASAVTAGTHAMGTMLAIAAGAFMLGTWLRSR